MTTEEALVNRKKCYEYLIGLGAMATKENLDVVRISIVALEEKLERENPKTLTLDELREMDGEPVWVIYDKGFEPLGLWALVEVCEESIFLTNNLGGRSEYAADVELEDDGITVYRQKPEPLC